MLGERQIWQLQHHDAKLGVRIIAEYVRYGVYYADMMKETQSVRREFCAQLSGRIRLVKVDQVGNWHTAK